MIELAISWDRVFVSSGSYYPSISGWLVTGLCGFLAVLYVLLKWQRKSSLYWAQAAAKAKQKVWKKLKVPLSYHIWIEDFGYDEEPSTCCVCLNYRVAPHCLGAIVASRAPFHRCVVCGVAAHSDWSQFASKGCKCVAQAGFSHVQHHWSERWIKMDENREMSSCFYCDEPCGVPFIDASPTWHCLWCQRLIHVKCHAKMSVESGDVCDLGPLRRIILSPLCCVKLQTRFDHGLCVKMVAAGAEHAAAITEDGDLYGWGWGRYGNLGLGDRNDRSIPEKVSAVHGEKMVLVACGWRHTISVSSSGGLYTFGWSKYGQLGHGDFEDHLVPHKLEALSGSVISQISGGWRHTMALTSEGKLYGWGWNKFGQVGVGDNIDHCAPVQVTFPNDEKVAYMACGWRHTLAITERNNVYSWGRGTCGQLGHGENVGRNTPKIIEALSFDVSDGNIQFCNPELSSGKNWVSPSERYALVPDEKTVQQQTVISGQSYMSDVSVPESEPKRMRVDV